MNDWDDYLVKSQIKSFNLANIFEINNIHHPFRLNIVETLEYLVNQFGYINGIIQM